MIIEVIQGDITKFDTDAIVNAAKPSLLGGSGVDGAIHNAAGKELLEACKLLGGAETGQSKITGSFGIESSDYIIHTVGPVYSEYTPEEAARLLASCYRESLELAKDFTSIAFPAISTGIYGYPIEEATEVAVATIQEWAAENTGSSLEKVTLLAYLDKDVDVLTSVVAAKTK